MNKAIGVITINDNNNYGNRLQNYAVQVILNRLGVESYSIENYPYMNSRKKYFLRKIKNIGFNRFYSNNPVRRERFEEFNGNIQYYRRKYSPFLRFSDLDYVLVGSDQVWNPEFGLDEATSLSTVPPQKRIAFSASFGVDDIDEENELLLEIKKFKCVSVREKKGAEVLRNHFGIEAQILIDPTLLLNSEEWNKVAKQPACFPEGKYILTYFLSPMSEKAKRVLQENKGTLKLVELSGKDGTGVNAGPSEFLYLFSHAELVLTDSFHACVFSFIYDKPFVVFDRNWTKQSMNSRINTFLENFSLERKYINSGMNNSIFEHDYSLGYQRLKNERKKSIDFLKKAFEVKQSGED